ncbi:UbiA family prenyltransferase [Actinoplanes sp. NPDC049548]|uniref:UbiA family prenyltransferase n=1 Tax=Actinoplanes sp. NPDC049548 TaxID=3155152 RepID=UPI00342E060E
MRLPTFSRQSDTSAETDTPTKSGAVQAGRAENLADADRDRAATERAADRAATERAAADRAADRAAARTEESRAAQTQMRRAQEESRTAERRTEDRDRTTPMPLVDDDKTRHADRDADRKIDRGAERYTGRDADRPVEAGPKPRASLLATLGLITGVAGTLLVLSGPLLGYGIGVAGLALVLSIAGIRATGKRHVAGKTDALIGMVLALAAIVVGVLALTGSLSWLGTDMQPVNSLREWLDTQFVDRF